MQQTGYKISFIRYSFSVQCIVMLSATKSVLMASSAGQQNVEVGQFRSVDLSRAVLNVADTAVCCLSSARYDETVRAVELHEYLPVLYLSLFITARIRTYKSFPL